jgi:hypothetical protein
LGLKQPLISPTKTLGEIPSKLDGPIRSLLQKYLNSNLSQSQNPVRPGNGSTIKEFPPVFFPLIQPISGSGSVEFPVYAAFPPPTVEGALKTMLKAFVDK